MYRPTRRPRISAKCSTRAGISSRRSLRRQLNGKNIQAKVKVTAKVAIAHHLRKVAMGRSHEPNVYMVSSTAAQTLEFLFLQYSQQFGLQRRWNIAHFVEEKRALVGQLEASKLLRNCSCERALFVAEELTFQQIQRDRSAIQLDKRASAPRTDIVYRACDQFLARACFALNQNRGACRRHSLDPFQYRFQRRATANELLEFARARTLITPVVIADTTFGWMHGKPVAHRVLPLRINARKRFEHIRSELRRRRVSTGTLRRPPSAPAIAFPHRRARL